MSEVRPVEPATGALRTAGLVAWVAVLVAGGAGSYLLYRGAVGGADEARALANAQALWDLERRMGLAWEAAAQRSPLGRGLPGAALTAFYALAYWPFLGLAAVATAVADRPALRLLRNAVMISGAVGLVIIVVVPVAPPRMFDGFDDTVAAAGALSGLAHPSSLLNPYAALPSFHVGWTVLAGLSLRRCWPQHGRLALAVPAAMAVAVVTTGNHWVLDAVAGVVLAGGAWRMAPAMQAALEDHRAQRQLAPPAGRATASAAR